MTLGSSFLSKLLTTFFIYTALFVSLKLIMLYSVTIPCLCHLDAFTHRFHSAFFKAYCKHACLHVLHRAFTPIFQHLWYRKVLFMLPKEKLKNKPSHEIYSFSPSWGDPSVHCPLKLFLLFCPSMYVGHSTSILCFIVSIYL